MKRNRLLLVAAIAAAMLAGCTPETTETLAPGASDQPQTAVTTGKPKTLVGTQWLAHEDYWPVYFPGMHVVLDRRWIFLNDSTVKYNASSEGAENFPACDTSEEGSYTYDMETGVVFMTWETISYSATYNEEMNALILEGNDMAFYREY